ncbi:toll/interleukin-1 receptor domain-containing protein, partial [Escherichia coli]|uniref:toll/interleukin-1 receptor domain-containing protein n=1 Tax=Escherichia coli TaxID=562 RepID=UPI003CE519F8
SYSDKDKTIAGKLAHKLKLDDFDVFLSHEHIIIGTEWEPELKNEIYNCELFLVLLSENFKMGDFTDHEVGIATSYDKRIFQIKIDN